MIKTETPGMQAPKPKYTFALKQNRVNWKSNGMCEEAHGGDVLFFLDRCRVRADRPGSEGDSVMDRRA